VLHGVKSFHAAPASQPLHTITKRTYPLSGDLQSDDAGDCRLVPERLALYEQLLRERRITRHQRQVGSRSLLRERGRHSPGVRVGTDRI
jgi:hypothetical protein